MQALFDFDSLRLLKLVLLLERIVGDDLVVHTVVELAVIIELVLSIDLPAFLAEAEDLLLDLHEFHDFATSFTLAPRCLLAHRRIERCEDDRLGFLVLERAVL